MCRKTLLLCILGAVLGSGPLRAQEPDEPVVAKQLYDISGRFQAVLSPVMSVADKYTRHVGVSLSAKYFFTDYLGLGLDFGYMFLNSDRKLLNDMINESSTLPTAEGLERLPITDLKRLLWNCDLDLILSPLYGKLNFSAEFAVNIHFYLLTGAGIGQYKYSELRWSASQFSKVNVTYTGGLLDSSIQPTFHVGGGLLLHLTNSWGMQLEIKDVFFYDKYEAQYSGDANNTITPKTLKDFVHIVFLRVGVAYAF